MTSPTAALPNTTSSTNGGCRSLTAVSSCLAQELGKHVLQRAFA
eukprot:CAMPEP_0204337700 /NCGR_PEP_ID=MMETSP0469-20131031/20526_1 /ASSEMBLY_ACC=CAM_ASM_000384 /TAXON_ID=2969 /ORGANISM="Oxyrrhis marina" /LENGTH=43 /DNA_ID= /DNA_START= /DNA_END= /DNA_ORIENTATION=